MKKNKNHLKYPPLEWLGFALVDVSLFLAYAYQFKHFYEILVLGLFLILYQLDKKYILANRYVRLYVFFVKAGLIGDLLAGLTIFHLWRYNYTNPLEYVSLYLIVYPIAGIVMVQTYVLVSKLFHLKPKSPPSPLRISTYKQLLVFFAATSLTLMLLISEKINVNLSVTLAFASITLLAFTLICYYSRVRNQDNILEELHNNPFKILLILFIATYANAFLHEIPNVKAQQWTYANFSIAQTKLFGVPLLVFVFWPLLTLIPVAVYYCVAPVPLKVEQRKHAKVKNGSALFLRHVPRHVSM